MITYRCVYKLNCMDKTGKPLFGLATEYDNVDKAREKARRLFLQDEEVTFIDCWEVVKREDGDEAWRMYEWNRQEGVYAR